MLTLPPVVTIDIRTALLCRVVLRLPRLIRLPGRMGKQATLKLRAVRQV